MSIKVSPQRPQRGAFLNFPGRNLDFRRGRSAVMEPGEWAHKALDIIESETRDLVHSGAPTRKSETELEIAPLVQKVGAISIAEIEKMIGELQAAKDFLESEGERVQREAEHYTTLTQMASGNLLIADIGRLKTERPVSFHGLLMCMREFAARRAKMDAILRKNHMADAAARAAPKSSNR